MKNHTDTLSQQTKTRFQETLEFKLVKQMETFPSSQQKNVWERKMVITRDFFINNGLRFQNNW